MEMNLPGNSTDPWALDDDLARLSKMVIAGGSLSLIGSIIVLIVYVRYSAVLRNGVMDAMMSTFVLAIPGSINFILSAALRLNGNSMASYCDFSGFITSLQEVSSTQMEGVFFMTVIRCLTGHHTDPLTVRRIFVCSLMFSSTLAIIPFATISANSTGSHYSAVEPWCWLPPSDEPNGGSSATLRYQRGIQYAWPIIAVIFGAISFVFALLTAIKAGFSLGSSIRIRFVYFCVFSAAWLSFATFRVLNSYLSDSAKTTMRHIQALVEPGLPFVNFLIFVVSEKVYVLIRQPAEYADDETSPCGRGGHLAGALCSLAIVNKSREDQFLAKTVRRTTPLMTEFDEDLQEWLVCDDDWERVGDEEEMITTTEKAPKKRRFIAAMPKIVKPPIGVGLSLLAGYCDSVGFVNLELMPAHVTGNTVLCGVSLASKDQAVSLQAILPKLIAIPVFCIVVIIGYSTSNSVKEHRRALLFSQVALLFTSFVAAVFWGPFDDDNKNTFPFYLTAMTMVSAMALQNSYQRFHLQGLPMTTFVTGNTNQICHDLVDWWRKRELPSADTQVLRTKLRNNTMCVLAFFLGAFSAAGVARELGKWSFMPPWVISVSILTLFWHETLTPPKK